MATKETKGIEVISFEGDQTPLYDPSGILEEIESKYPGHAEYQHIYLYRIDPKTRKQLQVQKYDVPPDTGEVQEDHGGGEYKVCIVFGTNGNKDRKTIWKAFSIEGPPKLAGTNGTASAPAQNNGSTLTAEGIAAAVKNAIPQDTGMSLLMPFMIKSMENQNNTMVALINNMSKNNGGGSAMDPVLTGAMAKMLERGMESDIERTRNTIKLAKELNPGGGKESDDITMKDLLPIAAQILGGMNKPTQQPVQTQPAQIQAPQARSNEAPGGNNGIAELKQMLINMANGVDQHLGAMNGKLDAAAERFKYIENYLHDDDPEGFELYENTESNVVEMPDRMNGEAKVNPELSTQTEEEKMSALNYTQALYLKNLPLDGQAGTETKVKYLKEFYAKGQTLKEIFDWCHAYKAVDTLCDFNDIAKAAGFEELPGDC